MSQFEKKEVVQAVLIADNNVELLRPISDETSTALIPLVNVPVIDYALESLNRNGIEEVFVFASHFIPDVRKHIKQRIESRCSWSVKMKVHIIGAEGSRCLGDSLRDLDAKGLVRGHFILMSADTITNANLLPILEQHKKTAKFDKGTALTVILKEDAAKLRTGDQIMIAMDSENNRLHFHHRLKQNSKESKFKIPLEVVLNNSNVAIHHNLIDPQISICSPTFLSLFSDNFDFQNRDDFIRGLLINEEILDSRVYVHMLPSGQYARKITNWITYQIVSNDVINRWAYPLVPDMGICCLWQNYNFLRNNIYKSPKANFESKVVLKDNIVIQAGTSIDSDTELEFMVIGKNCKIGKNCILKNSFIFNNVVIEDNCHLEYCVIAENSVIGKNSTLTDGTVIGSNVKLPMNSNFSRKLIQKNSSEYDDTEKIAENAYILNDEERMYTSDSEDDNIDSARAGIPKMSKLQYNCEDSDYKSTSDEDESREPSPILDDTNIFLSEVIDSLTRGFQESSNPDFLILEINSSRYAYNMTLKEVNYNVIKAMFSLPSIKYEQSSTVVLQNLLKVLKFFGPIIANYIKTEDAMLDCLNAIENCLNQQEILKEKCTQIIHYFYDKEYISEEIILNWYKNLPEDSEWLKKNLQKYIDWLMQSSEEESSDDE